MMKPVKIPTAGLFLFFLLLGACNNSMRDSDGNTYKTVKIDNQIWTAENIDVGSFRNGDSIPEAKTLEEWILAGNEGKPAWCHFENDSINSNKNGRLYNWYALADERGLAPKGWHIPTDDEWTGMINYLGGGVRAAMSLRSVNTLQEDKASEKPSFNALPSGCRNQNGVFYGLGSYGYWWSSTENDSQSAWLRVLNYAYCDINFISYAKSYGASVRFVKN
jgi:uncharacterized protein (TIGR02145 family)